MDPQYYSCQVSSLGSHFCSINWAVDLKINCIGEKVNYGQFTVKLLNFFIQINILNSYVSFDQVWTIILQEIWSNLQKGKIVKIRVLTEKGQFLLFDLANDQFVWSIISRVKFYHLDLMTWFKTLQSHWIDR